LRKKVHLVISGRVQGVCFRMYACDEARRLGLDGWVRNRSDGSVEAVAEGEEKPLVAFAAWCRRGPPHAVVSGMTEDWTEGAGDRAGFRIAY
jgi:acylphosphatase